MPGPAERPLTAAADNRGGAARQQPVIVLAYACSGAARIRRLLSGSAVLACTTGTGLLPLCAQAVATWQRVAARDGPPSPLALSSVRALAASMTVAILADTGKSRWCEIAFSPPAAAETFLRLYPATKFVCLRRSCPDVIRACVQANPWGLADTGLAPFAVAYPGSSAAAIAAYWAECTESLLRFEEAHPAACRQVRYENLTGHPDQQAREIFAFLGLHAEASGDGPGVAIDDADTTERAGEGTGALPEIPLSHLPLPLLERVNGLQARLGYPPIE